MIDIGAGTQMILNHLSSTGLLIGDGLAPKEGGWTEGSPNVDAFLAYSVLGFEGAAPDYLDLGMVSKTDWSTSWSIRHHGGSRKQADFQATAVRNLMPGLLKQTFGVHTYKVILLTWRSLGQMIRSDQIDPPFWTSTDLFLLGCSD